MEVNNHMLLFCLCVVFRFHLFVVDSEGFLQFFFHLLFIVLNHELGGNLGIRANYSDFKVRHLFSRETTSFRIKRSIESWMFEVTGK